jgi:dolichol-phosphate mannosyltransferase
MRADLAMIMPVYNEGKDIARVVASCRRMLSSLDISYRIVILNDGSRDDTAAQLNVFESDPNIEIIHHVNQGHGPTIMRGYRRGIEIAEWVFQCDSDDEISIHYFPEFWQKRDAFDAVLGIRIYGKRNLSRRIISWIALVTVRSFYGAGINDVNVPFRLMRASILEDLIPQIPPRTFAPNLIISGAILRKRPRLLQIPVQYQARRGGRSSIVRFKLWKAAGLSFYQTALFRVRSGSSKR